VLQAIIFLIGLLFWIREIQKIWMSRNSIETYVMKATNWINVVVILLVTATCSLYICRSVQAGQWTWNLSQVPLLGTF